MIDNRLFSQIIVASGCGYSGIFYNRALFLFTNAKGIYILSANLLI